MSRRSESCILKAMTVSEKEKMLASELYLSTDPQLQSALAEAQTYLRRLNTIPNEDTQLRRALLEVLLGSIGGGTLNSSRPSAATTAGTSASAATGWLITGACSWTAISSKLGMMLRSGQESISTRHFIRLIPVHGAAGWKGLNQSPSGTASGSEDVASSAQA